ncbi:MAG: nickel pincer cofactor biosynthesis protein LarB [Deltaproteobacteria bacterium]|nr:nickel pincer cofactor biosynthesis protein LarB [Deltaproteobacteria bacterium]
MERADLQRLLEMVRSGELDVAAALERLRALPFEDLGFAKIDHQRPLVRGLSEAIYAEPKPLADLVAIARAMWQGNGSVIATRVAPEQARALLEAIPAGAHDPIARTFCARREPAPAQPAVAVVSAGTSDRPVAGEAHNTLAHYGHQVIRIDDCGVAGVHRLLAQRPLLERAEAIVVVAGMEGALPSVVAGLVAAPVIAVPTSVGYGAAFGGLAALLGMLSSCAQGVSVVNIDNGFGAACAAALIARRRNRAEAHGSGFGAG